MNDNNAKFETYSVRALINGLQLKAGMPSIKDPGPWATALNPALEKFEINTPGRIAAFLAQVAVESQELTRLDENLNYKPERLMQVWPARFTTKESAAPYASNPHALANHVYANRGGNRDEKSGDGYRYRGQGAIMVTFHDGFAKVQKALGIPCLSCPEMLQTKTYAALSAALFWSDNELNFLADHDTENDFVTITRKINGGTTGLSLREKYLATFKDILGI
jgi:putative chitinase